MGDGLLGRDRRPARRGAGRGTGRPRRSARCARSAVAALRASGRHWKIALCSLSIGTMVAPPSCAARISSSPASTSDSLLASSRRLPARAAASVDGRPAAPTMAATTVSQSLACGQRVERVGAGMGLGVAGRRRAGRRAARRSRRRRRSPHGRGGARGTARAARRRCCRRRARWRAGGPGGARSTSSAEAPIEPVAPRTAISRIARIRGIRTRATALPSANTGSAASTLSMRSRMPPWPGIRWPESLTPAWRLSRLSNRSPTTETSAVTSATSATSRQLRAARAGQQRRAACRRRRRRPRRRARPSIVLLGLMRGASLRRPTACGRRNRRRCRPPRRSPARPAASSGRWAPSAWIRPARTRPGSPPGCRRPA